MVGADGFFFYFRFTFARFKMMNKGFAVFGGDFYPAPARAFTFIYLQNPQNPLSLNR